VGTDVLEEEFDLADVCLDGRQVDVGLIHDEGPLLAEELAPLVVVLVSQKLDGFEDGESRLQLLCVEFLLVVEADFLEVADVHVAEVLAFLRQSASGSTYIFCSLPRSFMRSSMWFLTESKEKT
jgi:hypothetical protein